MLFLPIGQEVSTVRRYPVVTFAIIAINVLVFVPINVLFDWQDWEDRLTEEAEPAIVYWEEHPYLEAPWWIPLLAEAPDDSAIAEGADAQWQQERLNQLLEPAMEVYEENPRLRYAQDHAHPTLRRALTSAFVHGGLMHLLGNMLFLFVTGPYIEDVFGRSLFAALYLSSGLVADFVQALKSGDGMSIGASGAVAGIMGAFLFRFGRRRFIFILFPMIVPFFWWRYRLKLSAFIILPYWFAVQVWNAAAIPEAGIGWWAHIAGFSFGAVATVLIFVSGLEKRLMGPGIEGRVSVPRHPSLDRSIEARLRGDYETARMEIQRVLDEPPLEDDVDAWREAYEVALAEGDSDEASTAADHVLKLFVDAEDLDLAERFAREARERLGDSLSVPFCLSAGGVLEEAEDPEGAVDFYKRAFKADPGKPAALKALVCVAELYRRVGQSERARSAYRQALSHPACGDHWGREIADALQELEDRPEPEA